MKLRDTVFPQKRAESVAPPRGGENAKTPRRRRGVLLSGDQIFVTILMPGPMVDAVTQDLMYWPFAAAGLALMIAPMSAL